MSALAILFIVFIGLLIIGVPIGVSVGWSMIAVALFTETHGVTGEYVYRNIASCLDSYIILAVPLFIFCGVIMGRGGSSNMFVLWRNFRLIPGHCRGSWSDDTASAH